MSDSDSQQTKLMFGDEQLDYLDEYNLVTLEEWQEDVRRLMDRAKTPDQRRLVWQAMGAAFHMGYMVALRDDVLQEGGFEYLPRPFKTFVTVPDDNTYPLNQETQS